MCRSVRLTSLALGLLLWMTGCSVAIHQRPSSAPSGCGSSSATPLVAPRSMFHSQVKQHQTTININSVVNLANRSDRPIVIDRMALIPFPGVPLPRLTEATVSQPWQSVRSVIERVAHGEKVKPVRSTRLEPACRISAHQPLPMLVVGLQLPSHGWFGYNSGFEIDYHQVGTSLTGSVRYPAWTLLCSTDAPAYCINKLPPAWPHTPFSGVN